MLYQVRKAACLEVSPLMRFTETPPDQYIKVGDTNTRYWVLGDGETTVILLHGLGSCVESWTYNIVTLAQQHRVYAIDLVGSGRSDKPPTSYSLVDLAQFVQAFMDALKLERVSLVGNSLGGELPYSLPCFFLSK
jgi:4,5:9,10-diseco-3-hydroxy-5,9,17-trioxoandrosta-1(10),2-diene-4-oate hydrolase